MIVYEKNGAFVMIRQDDHGRLAGEIAGRLKDEFFAVGMEKKSSVLFAISEHDGSWVDLDEVPLWNDRDEAPYTFQDMPLLLRLPFYIRGIDEMEERDEYAALLHSIHYTSFNAGALPVVGGFPEKAVTLIGGEKSRQQMIKQRLRLNNPEGEAMIQHHLQILQLCDFLSLYICFKEPGTQEADPFSNYKQIFAQHFSVLKGEELKVGWISHDQLSVRPFLLKEKAQFHIRYKEVNKTDVRENGIVHAYQNSPWQESVFQLV